MADQQLDPPGDPREGSDGPSINPQQELPGERYTSPSEGKTRDELIAAKEYAEMIVNTIREALLVLDLNFHVRSASRSFYQTFETTPEETEGRLLFELGDGQWDIPELRELLESILPESKSFDDFEVTHEFEGIGERFMLLNARQINHHGLILLAIEDVTERRVSARRLRESQERFDLLVQNAEEYAIFMMDRDTRITTWNPGAERILGWSAEEVIGRKGDIIFTEAERQAGVADAEIARAAAAGSSKDDRWHVRKDGSRFWATGFMVALYGDEGLRGFAKILRDDTQKKMADEEREKLLEALDKERRELRNLTETLEERVAERTAEVRKLASTLTMAEQQERRRISQVLHDELQQILYGIQLKMAHVRRDAKAENTDRVEENAVQIEQWLRDAVDTTRRLTVELSPPLLQGEGFRDALDWLKRQMRELHGLEVSLKADHSFRMDDQDLRVLLFQTVRELLFNVVKHAQARTARVELEQLDGRFAIHVVDEGAGFDVEEAERQAASGPAGGFGLFNARERIGLFGGGIEIESAPGEGTRVTIVTPVVLNLSDEGSRRTG